MLTKTQLEERGWQFAGAVAAHEDGREIVTTAEQAPIFHLARAIAFIEGDADAFADEVDAKLVKKVSGEKWVDHEPWTPTPEQHAEKLDEIRDLRDRLLDRSDYIAQFIAFGHPADLPDDVKAAITANADAWLAYRVALRDYPATVTNSYDPPALPEPPAVPAIRLT